MQIAKIIPGRIILTTAKEKNAVLNLNSIANRHRRTPKLAHLVKDFQFNENSRKNLLLHKSSPDMSANAKRQFRQRVLSMLYLSPGRTVFRPGKNPIYNFRQGFHTLTLPAQQFHSDVEIKAALGKFLTNLREIFGIDNYVWKAELQKNENIHFHLILDKYISFDDIRYYWNQQLDNLGYIDVYADKFLQMDWHQYRDYRVNQAIAYGVEPDFGKIRNAFNSGQSAGWRNPNTVDSRVVRSDKEVANYLQKYLSKSSGSDDFERLKAFGRLWASSRSLSGLKYQNYFDWDDIKSFCADLLSQCSKAVNLVSYDYCRIIYFKFEQLTSRFKNFIKSVILKNALTYQYPVPV